MKNKTRPSETSVAFYNNPEIRAVIYQILALASIAFFVYFMIGNMFENIEKRGITTGFDFLSSEAGFGITQSLLEYDESDSHGRVFLIGLMNTVLVSFVFATIKFPF